MATITRNRRVTIRQLKEALRCNSIYRTHEDALQILYPEGSVKVTGTEMFTLLKKVAKLEDKTGVIIVYFESTTDHSDDNWWEFSYEEDYNINNVVVYKTVDK